MYCIYFVDYQVCGQCDQYPTHIYIRHHFAAVDLFIIGHKKKIEAIPIMAWKYTYMLLISVLYVFVTGALATMID